MSAYTLPLQAYINKFIPKNKFFEKAVVSSKLKHEFVEQIEKITWKYKLAESTIGVAKTTTIEEIQIFTIQLRQKSFPKNVLKLINKAIPYPILYEFVYEQDTAYGILYEETYYFSEWNQPLVFELHGINLEKVYQNIVTAFLSPQRGDVQDFDSLIQDNTTRKLLEKEIETLQRKCKQEKQFNKQVAINQQIQQKKQQLKHLGASL